MRTGGCIFSIVRTCTGDVCVRRSIFSRDVERVARIACRMAGGNIQGVEVVVGAFDFRTILDGVAHRDEDVFDLFADDRQRMAVSDAPAIARQRDIQRFALQRRVLFALGDRRSASVSSAASIFDFDFIGDAAEFRALRLWEACRGSGVRVVRRPDLRER